MPSHFKEVLRIEKTSLCYQMCRTTKIEVPFMCEDSEKEKGLIFWVKCYYAIIISSPMYSGTLIYHSIQNEFFY